MTRRDLQPLDWGKVAWTGAQIGIAATFAYASLFGLYAIARSAGTILDVLGPFAAWGTLTTVALTLAYLVTAFALLLALGPALAGAASALLIAGASRRWNGDRSPDKAIGIGFLVAGLLVVPFLALVRLGLGERFALAHWETVVFWFGLPSFVFVTACLLTSLTWVRRTL